MKSLLASICCLAVLVTAWAIYDHYSDHKLHGFINEIEDKIIPAVEHDNWGHAESAFEKISDDWHKYKKISAFFFDRKSLNDADYSIAKSKYYIKANDLSNATSELACLKEQLSFLHANERFHIQNIL